jgi:hypothetical protein
VSVSALEVAVAVEGVRIPSPITSITMSSNDSDRSIDGCELSRILIEGRITKVVHTGLQRELIH